MIIVLFLFLITFYFKYWQHHFHNKNSHTYPMKTGLKVPNTMYCAVTGREVRVRHRWRYQRSHRRSTCRAVALWPPSVRPHVWPPPTYTRCHYMNMSPVSDTQRQAGCLLQFQHRTVRKRFRKNCFKFLCTTLVPILKFGFPKRKDQIGLALWYL